MQTFKIIINILLMLFSLSCCSQSNDSFRSFKSKFKDSELPIKGENLPKNETISQEEFNLYIVKSNSWEYGGDYSYNSSVKFPLRNGIIALIYIRSYYPDNIGNEKMEIVLSTFNKVGGIISSLPIHGIHGDELVFYGSIDKNYSVMIDSQKFEYNNKTKKSISIKDKKKYQINKNTGEILAVE